MDELVESVRHRGPRIGSAVVLHIEDDGSVARAVGRLLRLQGYQVESAVSSDEAIHLIEEGLVPDLILTDYHLPQDITGEQTVLEITTRLGFKPPTIMLASLPGPQVAKVRSVADRVFAKPADMDEVLNEIGRLLSTLT
jgi:DNA-binding response OmpR family regulator